MDRYVFCHEVTGIRGSKSWRRKNGKVLI